VHLKEAEKLKKVFGNVSNQIGFLTVELESGVLLCHNGRNIRMANLNSRVKTLAIKAINQTVWFSTSESKYPRKHNHNSRSSASPAEFDNDEEAPPIDPLPEVRGTPNDPKAPAFMLA
jgi:hypothetical protein